MNGLTRSKCGTEFRAGGDVGVSMEHYLILWRIAEQTGESVDQVADRLLREYFSAALFGNLPRQG